MTVSYSRLVANGSSFGCFWSILFKWRGSVYKLIWRELLVYLMLYYAINFTYRYGMNDQQQNDIYGQSITNNGSALGLYNLHSGIIYYQRRRFEELKEYFVKHLENIPMAFVLAFYVTLVVKRWWEQYRLLPWPDTLALFVSAAIPGVDERGRLMRRNIVRYAVLAYVITLKHVSVRVKKRFPTLQHIVDAGLMMESEKKIVEMMDERSPMAKYWMPLVWATNIINRARKEQLISSDHVVQTLLMELSEHRRKLGSIISYDTVCVPLVYTQISESHHLSTGHSRGFIGLMMESEKKIFEMLDERHPMTKYWLPLTWATNIINRARKENMIYSDHMVQTLLYEMSDIRQRLGGLIGYDNVTVPLVYTQVVTLSVYIYFISALLGRQFVNNHLGKPGEYDMYFPVFTALQFCFYIGWLKVAEVLIGPFGEDDDDIELNWLIDRHVKAAYMIVDEMHEEHPELLKDQYWDEVVPKDLPYTLASEHYRRHEPKGSAEHYKVKESDAIYANVNNTHRKSVIHDDVYADYESVDTPLVERRKNWFQRQMQRMGSIRSASTTYSSNGLFGQRTRHNSVYSSPDAVVVGPGGVPLPNGSAPGTHQLPPHPPHKMSIYDRILGRKSTRRGSRGRVAGKLNVSAIPPNLRNRPRIPTPDTTKESVVMDKDNKPVFPNNNNNLVTTISGSVDGSEGTIPPQPNGEFQQQQEFPSIVQVMLSPIQELDASQSTITSTGSTAALAQAVLSPSLTSAGLMPGAVIQAGTVVPGVIQPIRVVNSVPVVSVTMPQTVFNSLLTTTQAPSPQHSPKVTELPPDDRNDSACGSSSGSTASNDDRSRKTSVTSQRRGEVYV